MQANATDDEPSSRRQPQTPAAARVAVCSAEAFAEGPAGPALRAAGLARGLAAHGLEVTLLAPSGSNAPDGCRVAALDDIVGVVQAGTTMIASGFLVERYPVLTQAAHLVVDASGPFLLENMVIHGVESPVRRRQVLADESAVLGRLLASADLVLCAHDRQRDLMLGIMLATGALRPELIDADPSLAQLFTSIPFGPTGGVEPVQHRGHAGRLHLVWPGGLWDWLDPICLIEAIAKARMCEADVTAELWGARSPDPLVPPSRSAALVAQRARQLGLEDAVEIVDWVAHSDRLQRLAEADAAITLDKGGIEARYAFRTRLVDALASGLPVIATEGEFVADEAAGRGAGFTVPPSDPDALSELLQKLALEPARLAVAAGNAPAIAADWAYERTVEPLADWCRSPRRLRAGAPTSSRSRPGTWAGARSLRRLIQRASNSFTSAS